MWKIELQKAVGDLLDKLTKLHMNGTVIKPSSSNRKL